MKLNESVNLPLQVVCEISTLKVRSNKSDLRREECNTRCGTRDCHELA